MIARSSGPRPPSKKRSLVIGRVQGCGLERPRSSQAQGPGGGSEERGGLKSRGQQLMGAQGGSEVLPEETQFWIFQELRPAAPNHDPSDRFGPFPAYGPDPLPQPSTQHAGRALKQPQGQGFPRPGCGEGSKSRAVALN